MGKCASCLLNSSRLVVVQKSDQAAISWCYSPEILIRCSSKNKGSSQKINFYHLNLIFWIAMGCGIARFGQRGLKTTETWKFWSQNLSPGVLRRGAPGVSRHSTMGFRGAAQGFRGTAPWGFEGQHHGVSRGSNKWDGTSRGGAGVSRHSNMGQGYRGDIFYISVQQILNLSQSGEELCGAFQAVQTDSHLFH